MCGVCVASFARSSMAMKTTFGFADKDETSMRNEETMSDLMLSKGLRRSSSRRGRVL
jgi:hypothetical protein